MINVTIFKSNEEYRTKTTRKEIYRPSESIIIHYKKFLPEYVLLCLAKYTEYEFLSAYLTEGIGICI